MPRPPTFLESLWSASKFGAFAIGGFVYFTEFLATVDTVNGSSMAPTLNATTNETGKKDKILIERIVPLKSLQRGDIVTFWKPHKPNEISIKRIVGLPGDEVWPRDREAEAGYKGNGIGQRKNYDLQGMNSLIVPHGHVWVEGDNWRGSFDSNDFGPISHALINGRARWLLRGLWRTEIPKKQIIKGDTRVAGGKADLPDPTLY